MFKRPRIRPRRPLLENLEGRTLLSGNLGGVSPMSSLAPVPPLIMLPLPPVVWSSGLTSDEGPPSPIDAAFAPAYDPAAAISAALPGPITPFSTESGFGSNLLVSAATASDVGPSNPLPFALDHSAPEIVFVVFNVPRFEPFASGDAMMPERAGLPDGTTTSGSESVSSNPTNVVVASGSIAPSVTGQNQAEVAVIPGSVASVGEGAMPAVVLDLGHGSAEVPTNGQPFDTTDLPDTVGAGDWADPPIPSPQGAGSSANVPSSPVVLFAGAVPYAVSAGAFKLSVSTFDTGGQTGTFGRSGTTTLSAPAGDAAAGVLGSVAAIDSTLSSRDAESGVLSGFGATTMGRGLNLAQAATNGNRAEWSMSRPIDTTEISTGVASNVTARVGATAIDWVLGKWASSTTDGEEADQTVNATGLILPAGADLIRELLPFSAHSIRDAVDQFVSEIQDLEVGDVMLGKPRNVVLMTTSIALGTLAAAEVMRRKLRQRRTPNPRTVGRTSSSGSETIGFPELPGSWSSRYF